MWLFSLATRLRKCILNFAIQKRSLFLWRIFCSYGTTFFCKKKSWLREVAKLEIRQTGNLPNYSPAKNREHIFNQLFLKRTLEWKEIGIRANSPSHQSQLGGNSEKFGRKFIARTCWQIWVGVLQAKEQRSSPNHFNTIFTHSLLFKLVFFLRLGTSGSIYLKKPVRTSAWS